MLHAFILCYESFLSSLLIFRYYHGPTPIQSLQYATSQDIINSFQSIRQEMEAYTPKLTQVGDLYCLKTKVPLDISSIYEDKHIELYKLF